MRAEEDRRDGRDEKGWKNAFILVTYIILVTRNTSSCTIPSPPPPRPLPASLPPPSLRPLSALSPQAAKQGSSADSSYGKTSSGTAVAASAVKDPFAGGDGFRLSGNIALFNSVSLGANVDIDDKGWNVQMHYHDQAFDFFIGLKSGQYASAGSSKTGSSKGAPDDFSLDASINLEGLSHLEAELVAKLKVAKSDVDGRIGTYRLNIYIIFSVAKYLH